MKEGELQRERRASLEEKHKRESGREGFPVGSGMEIKKRMKTNGRLVKDKAN